MSRQFLARAESLGIPPSRARTLHGLIRSLWALEAAGVLTAQQVRERSVEAVGEALDTPDFAAGLARALRALDCGARRVPERMAS